MLYVKTSLFTESLFTFGKFVYVRKFYKMFIFFPTMISIKNSFCEFLARVKTYTHTKIKHVHLLVLIWEWS